MQTANRKKNLNKSTQIKSLISTSLAVMLLLVYSLSGFVHTSTYATAKNKTDQKESTSSDKHTEINQDYDFLAVNSSLSVDSHFEPFSFPQLVSFQYIPKNVYKALRYFERNLHLKILFEHLTAPNAP